MKSNSFDRDKCSCGHQRNSHAFTEWNPEGLCTARDCECKNFLLKRRILQISLKELEGMKELGFISEKGIRELEKYKKEDSLE